MYVSFSLFPSFARDEKEKSKTKKAENEEYLEVTASDYALIVKSLPEIHNKKKEVIQEPKDLKEDLHRFFEEKYGTGIMEGVNEIILTENISKQVELRKKKHFLIKEKEILINKYRYVLNNRNNFIKEPPTFKSVAKIVKKESKNWLKRIYCCRFLTSNEHIFNKLIIFIRIP